MNQFFEWVRSNTNRLTEVIRQGLLVGIGFGLLQWDDAQQAMVLMFVSAVMALITEKNTVSNARFDERTEQKVQKEVTRRMTGSGTGSGSISGSKYL